MPVDDMLPRAVVWEELMPHLVQRLQCLGDSAFAPAGLPGTSDTAWWQDPLASLQDSVAAGNLESLAVEKMWAILDAPSEKTLAERLRDVQLLVSDELPSMAVLQSGAVGEAVRSAATDLEAAAADLDMFEAAARDIAREHCNGDLERIAGRLHGLGSAAQRVSRHASGDYLVCAPTSASLSITFRVRSETLAAALADVAGIVTLRRRSWEAASWNYEPEVYFDDPDQWELWREVRQEVADLRRKCTMYQKSLVNALRGVQPSAQQPQVGAASGGEASAALRVPALAWGQGQQEHTASARNMTAAQLQNAEKIAVSRIWGLLDKPSELTVEARIWAVQQKAGMTAAQYMAVCSAAPGDVVSTAAQNLASAVIELAQGCASARRVARELYGKDLALLARGLPAVIKPVMRVQQYGAWRSYSVNCQHAEGMVKISAPSFKLAAVLADVAGFVTLRRRV